MADGDIGGGYGGYYGGRGGYGAAAGRDLYGGISSFGNDIQRAMMYYHQQHVQYDQQMQLATALSRLGINQQGAIVPMATDEKGKPLDKNIRQIIDPQALQMFQAGNQQQRVQATGALNALNRVLMQQVGRGIGNAMLMQRPDVQARIEGQQATTRYRNLQAANLMGLLPKPTVLPTGGQILAEQRAQRREAAEQRDNIATTLFNSNIPDPQMLLQGVQFQQRGTFGRTTNLDSSQDKSGNWIVPPNADQVLLDNDKTLPIKTFNRLYPQAQQWRELGRPAPKTILPNNPRDIGALLTNPSDRNRAIFDGIYGPGSADAVINAQTKASAAATPSPAPADQEVTPEEEQAATEPLPGTAPPTDTGDTEEEGNGGY